MLVTWISLLLSNFGLAMFGLAVILIIFHRLFIKRLSIHEIIYRWVALFALGFTSIYAFIMHAFFPVFTAASIGWQDSPFQLEVAMANLGFGLIGVLSFNASYGFRLATVIGSACWLWGDAVGHLYQLIKYSNYSVGNAGSWFWMDIFIPFILIYSIFQLRLAREYSYFRH